MHWWVGMAAWFGFLEWGWLRGVGLCTVQLPVHCAALLAACGPQKCRLLGVFSGCPGLYLCPVPVCIPRQQ